MTIPMRRVTLARKIALAAFLCFAATLATLLARQLNFGHSRAVPAFRAFGPETAAIRIEEYTDFACPSCKAAYLQLEALLKVYPDGIALTFKHYPLTGIHKWSLDAAVYSDCAGEQGRFRDYADLLFENQERWGRADKKPAEFAEFAEKLKLDQTAFEACANKAETLRKVRLEMAEGDLKGVGATPTFFINGKRHVGANQLLEAAKHFDNVLKQKKNGNR